MPWKPSDASEHTKKANTPAKKKTWADTANSVLKDCLAKGGDQKTCEAKAIRIANSKMTEGSSMSQKVPKFALILQEQRGEDTPLLQFAENAEGKKKLDMTIYSGGIIKGHWYWGSLGIDLQGIKLTKPKYPILESHDTSRKIAWMSKPLVAESLKVDPDKVTFLDTDAATEFQQNAEKGFPYESSLYGIPSKIERVEEGASTMVNGHKLEGPGTVWREWQFKEASVCTFGYDSNTSAKIFADQEVDVEYEEKIVGLSDPGNKLDEGKNKQQKEVKSMDIETLKAEHPDVFSAIVAQTTQDLQAKFDKEKKDLQDKLADKDKEVVKLSQDVAELKKTDALRTDRENSLEAKQILSQKLSVSEVPETLHDKVAVMLPYTKFVKDGILDKVAFAEAATKEIEDWEQRGIKMSVIGGVGPQSKDLDSKKKEAEKLAQADDAAVDEMLKLAGDAGDTEE